MIKKREEKAHLKQIEKINLLLKLLNEKEKSVIIATNNKERQSALKLHNSLKELKILFKSNDREYIQKDASNKPMLALYNKLQQHSIIINSNVDDALSSLNEKMNEINYTQANYMKNINISMAIIILVLISFSILFSIFILSATKKSLIKLQTGLLDFFKFLNSETQNTQPLYESKDEIGKVARVLNKNIKEIKINLHEDKKFIDETINILSEFERGDLNQRVNLSVKNPSLVLLKQKLDGLY